MNSLAIIPAALLAFAIPAVAADCTMPAMPELPNGATATMEEMVAGQQAMKSFQVENAGYMTCLEEGFQVAEAKVKSASDATVQAEARKLYGQGVDAFNAAVIREEQVAEKFNEAVRAFKEANPS